MVNIDDEWENFLQDDTSESIEDITDLFNNMNIDRTLVNNLKSTDINFIPKCSELYISTKTKISYINKEIDIVKTFWDIPVENYSSPIECVIKKQIKLQSKCKEDVDVISNKLNNVKYYEEYIIQHIENPDGQIKYKDQRKITIGISKKDILSYRSKQKKAFFNCFVIIMRLLYNNEFKEMHIKVFNTGKIEIPGIQNDELLYKILDFLVIILKPYLGDDLKYIDERNETVLINSNFNCGYFIERDKLYEILKYNYRINSNYDPCSYPGIQCKFYYDNLLSPTDIQTGQQPKHKDYQKISFMVFRTGSVLIVGKCNEDVLNVIYKFIRKILENEYIHIHSLSNNNDKNINKDRKKKIRKKIILIG